MNAARLGTHWESAHQGEVPAGQEYPRIKDFERVKSTNKSLLDSLNDCDPTVYLNNMNSREAMEEHRNRLEEIEQAPWLYRVSKIYYDARTRMSCQVRRYRPSHGETRAVFRTLRHSYARVVPPHKRPAVMPALLDAPQSIPRYKKPRIEATSDPSMSSDAPSEAAIYL